MLRDEHIIAWLEVLTSIASKYSKLKKMDKDTFNNWVKVKETFESSGNTENFFYKRACAIVQGSPDPMGSIVPETNYGNNESQ